MKHNEQLKPCPFCGGKGEIHQAPINFRLGIEDEVYWVQCRNCFAKAGNSYSEEKAISGWNRRKNREMDKVEE